MLLKVEESENKKELNYFLRAFENCFKYIGNLLSITDILRQLSKKDTKWKWTEQHKEALEKLKKLIADIPCLSQYNSIYPNYVTTDVGTNKRGTTLWREQTHGE